MSHDALDRLHRRLLEAVKGASTEPLDRPLTIADVYQHLVPYRSVRGELGFTELKEYEHTLLRLFAGERKYVEVQVQQVADEFTRELRSPNPILGIYRDYAAVGISLNPGSTAAAEKTPPRPAAAEPSRDATRPPALAPEPVRAEPSRDATRPPALAPEPVCADPSRDATQSPALAAEPVRAEPSTDHGLVTADPWEPPLPTTPEEPRAVGRLECWSCQEPLPQKREVRFCPHCGTVQVPTPCEECGAPVDADWKFCVLCGSSRAQLPVMPAS